MDFNMDIDHSRKRFRDELDLANEACNPVTKRARQSDTDASPRESTVSTPGPSESGVSTPASIDVDMDMEDPLHAPEPTPKAKSNPQTQIQPQSQQFSQPQFQPQPRTQSTIISGWNQSRRNQYLRQGYPLYWMQNSTQ